MVVSSQELTDWIKACIMSQSLTLLKQENKHKDLQLLLSYSEFYRSRSTLQSFFHKKKSLGIKLYPTVPMMFNLRLVLRVLFSSGTTSIKSKTYFPLSRTVELDTLDNLESFLRWCLLILKSNYQGSHLRRSQVKPLIFLKKKKKPLENI